MGLALGLGVGVSVGVAVGVGVDVEVAVGVGVGAGVGLCAATTAKLTTDGRRFTFWQTTDLPHFWNYTRRFILSLIRAETRMKYWEVIADNLSNAG